MKDDVLGCEVCNAAPLERAGKDDLPFEEVRCLHDSSHSSFTLCECKHCRQPYLEQFHEIIDWSGGNDTIWMRWEPLTAEEVENINIRFPDEYYNSSVWNELYEYMHIRRRLVRSPNGIYKWDDHSSDPGDMMPPG